MAARHFQKLTLTGLAVAPLLLTPLTAQALTFTANDLVVSIYGNGDGSGAYTDNQAAPIVLQQLTPTGQLAGSMILPQSTTTANGTTQYAISGEYGSSSEGALQRSVDGKSLVIAGYGINAATYNAGGGATYGNAALAQSTSVPGGQYTAIPRVIANIRADGTTDTSTALYNVFNTNNPRSVATVDGSSFYIAGQGVSGDATQGLFYATKGATTATPIDTSTDARTVSIVGNQLYVSRDTKQGGKEATITNYGATLPTTANPGTNLSGIGPQINSLTTKQANGVNNNRIGNNVYLSPENYFFANTTTLYIADGGKPKNGNAGQAAEGDGGLQKWVLTNGTWSMVYDLSAGLNLVANTAASGTTGLIGLTGTVNNDGTVSLYSTNETVGDLDPTFVYAITDTLSATSGTGETFTTIYTAASGTNVRGIALAPTVSTPVPEPATLPLLAGIFVLSGLVRRKR